MKLVIIFSHVHWKILPTETLRKLIDVHNAESQYFLMEQCIMLQNYGRVKDLFKMQHRAVNFNVTVQKFIDKVSGFML
jgi:hypothetical protein